MIIVFLVVLAATVAVNWYIILFGKKDLEQLKNKVSIKKYLAEIEDSIDKSFGKKITTIVKLALIAVSIVVIVANAFLFLVSIGAFVLGVFLAKKSYEFGPVANVLRRIAIYINRVR